MMLIHRSAYHRAMATAADRGVHVQYPVELLRGEQVWEYSSDFISKRLSTSGTGASTNYVGYEAKLTLKILLRV
jgi:hypothetical protein